MRKTTITLEVQWDENDTDDPMFGNWVALLDLPLAEYVRVVTSETEQIAPRP